MQAFLTGAKRNENEPNVPKSDTKSSSVNQEKPTKLLPWVEKYRPKTVDEVAYQDEVVSILKKCVQGADLPNLLFYGPPGTGKTSAALAMAKEIFGQEIFRDRVLELNASDERGIQVIRDKVKKFAQFSASAFRPDGKPCPPLKLIILDEADSMTSAAQAALRRTMEKESKTTRFCLICNYISRIIEPLTSRCAKLRFKPLTNQIQTERLKFVCIQENVDVEDEALLTLVNVCEGDLRRAITGLQSVAKFKNGATITAGDVAELTGIIPNDILDQFMTACRKNRYELLEKCVMNLLRQGYSAYQTMNQLHDIVLEDPTVTDLCKAYIFDKLAVCEHRLLSGADEFLQLMDLGCCIMQSFQKENV